MSRLSGAEALVAQLRAHGIDTVFGLPGGQLDHFFDAMYRDGGLRVIHTRHEQGAAYMAYGYAKSTAKVGTFAVVPGPGLLNTTAALSTGWANHAKMLCISGQIPSTSIGRGTGDLHEIQDQLGLIRHLTKWAERIDHPTDAPRLVDEAFRQLQTGRPRPVELEMPMDVMASRAEVTLTSAPSAYAIPPLDEESLDAALALIGESRRPMIVVGSGAQGACAEVLALAEHLQAPVMAKRNGKGVVPSSHYLSANIPLGHRAWSESDLVIAIGTRLRMPLVMWGKDEALKILRIDIDPAEIARVCKPELGIVGDAATVAAALLGKLRRHTRPRDSREEELRNRKAALEKEIRETVAPQMAWLDAIRATLPADGIFVDEVTQVGFASWYGFPVEKPRQHITAGYQGTLGFGFATALGVVAAHPGKRVVQVSGDGGFLFTVQELATAVQYQLPLVSIVFNDRRFTNVQRQQKEWFGGRVLCSDLHNPDFVKLAEAFGAMGERIRTPAELPAALERAFAANAPAIIEVDLEDFFPSPWRYILMPQNRGALCR